MQTAKIFTTGRSQAVRLPKAFQFNTQEVLIRHFGNGVLLIPKDKTWETMQQALDEFETGFVMEREPQDEPAREEIL